MNTLTGRLASVAVSAAVALVAAGCSSGTGSGGGYGGGGAYGAGNTRTSSAVTTTAASSAVGGAAAAGTAVTATEQEFSITLSRTSFSPGAYTFTVHNAGRYAHNLTIEGPGVDKKASPTEPGGGSGTLSVTLAKGTYELWCSVDSHKDKGMDIRITVA